MINELTYEAKLIALLLVWQEHVNEASYIVSPDDFAVSRYRIAFDYIVTKVNAGEFVDFIAVSALAEMPKDEVMTLASLAVSETEIVPTAKAIHDMAQKRKIAAIAQATLVEAENIVGLSSEELIDQAVDGLHNLRVGERRGKSQSLLSATVDLYLWLNEKIPDKYIDTGFGALDDVLCGLRPGNLVLLAARPAVGKSAFAANIALTAARSGATTLFFSCEMTTHEILLRYAASETRVPLNNIVNRNFDSEDTEKCVKQTVEGLGRENAPLFIIDQPGIRTQDIRREMQAHKNVGLVVVDYIQLMRSSERAENRNLEVAKISSELKLLAKEFGIPVLALSQLNRAKDETDEPGLPDLRDSGSLEQDADKVIMLWLTERPKDGEMKKVGVKVAKNRMGAVSTVVLRFDGATMTFHETDDEYTPKPKPKKNGWDNLTEPDSNFPTGW